MRSISLSRTSRKKTIMQQPRNFFSSGTPWSVACVYARVHIYVPKEATKQRCPHIPSVRGSMRAGLWCCTAHTVFLRTTHLFPPSPRCSGTCDIDLTLTVLCLRWGLSVWMCCSGCHSDNMWIKLSLTLPLRKAIQVQSRHATLHLSSLSMMKLIL